MIRLVGIMLGALSLAALAQTGFGLEFKAPAVRYVDYYESLMQWLLGRIEPFVQTTVFALPVDSNWDGHLRPHWKHIVVLMWLFFGAQSRIRAYGLFRLAWGGIIAIAVGAACGTVALDSRTSSLLLMAFPFAGVILQSLGIAILGAMGVGLPFLFKPAPQGYSRSQRARGMAWNFLAFEARFPLYYTVLGGIALLVGSQAETLPYIMTLPNPVLALLGVFIVVDALCWLLTALRAPGGANSKDSWIKTFVTDPYMHFGVTVLLAMGSAALLVGVLTSG